ncbi:trypsin-like serine protease [Saccharopolyspora shandongensis]|nr:trypsin-like serine protease [Saccharopolyspora shandongensis]
MRSRSLLLGVALALTAPLVGAVPAQAIVGGAESTQPYSFMVSLQYDAPRPDGHRCGAVLIAPQWAVTAGHCANSPTGATAGVPRGWKVRVGSLDTTSGGEVTEIDEFYRRHNAYPVTFFVAPDLGVVVARSGMTDAPSRRHDPGGGVTGPGGIDRPLIGTRPPAGQVSS